MIKKYLGLQSFLLFVGLFLLIGTYFYYPNLKKNEVNEDDEILEELDKNLEEQRTSFRNVEYQGYNLENPFVIKSEEAYILNDDAPNMIHMVKMHLILYLKDGKEIEIVSDKGKFNKITNDCFFESNVLATESLGETTISADNLNLLSTSSTAEIFNNVNLFNHEGSFLKADKIEYDFVQKKLKVSMFDEEKIEMKVVSN